MDLVFSCPDLTRRGRKSVERREHHLRRWRPAVWIFRETAHHEVGQSRRYVWPYVDQRRSVLSQNSCKNPPWSARGKWRSTVEKLVREETE
ncbi:MAG: hypothetical protein ACRD9W_08215, partial [Terriglobia bacterium]